MNELRKNTLTFQLNKLKTDEPIDIRDILIEILEELLEK